MEFKQHPHPELKIVQVISPEVIVHDEQDALDLMGETRADALILSVKNFDADFFDLSTKKLGNILQKLTNYRVKLAIVGDFASFPSKVLPDFIRESNRRGEYLFVSSLEAALEKWK